MSDFLSRKTKVPSHTISTLVWFMENSRTLRKQRLKFLNNCIWLPFNSMSSPIFMSIQFQMSQWEGTQEDAALQLVKYHLISTNKNVAFLISLKLAFKTQWKRFHRDLFCYEVICYQYAKISIKKKNATKKS